MKQLQLEQFMQYRFLSNLQCSEKAGRLAFVSAMANEENGYDSHIYLYEDGKVRQLTGFSESNYIWDGEETLLFTSVREEADRKALAQGEERTSFYRMPVNGGEAVRAFCVPLSVMKFEKVREGVYIFLVRYDLRFSGMYQMDEAGKKKMLAEKKEEADYQVVSETPFRFDGMGWTNGLRSRLFLYEEAEDKLTPLTQTETFTVSSFELSEDHRRVLLVGSDFTYVKAEHPGVFELDLESGKIRELIAENTWDLGPVCYYRDGVLAAATKGTVHGGNENPDFYFYDPDTGKMTLLGTNGYSLHTGVGTDCKLGGGHMNRVRDGVFYTGIVRGYEGPLMKLTEEGTLEEVVSVRGNVDDFDIRGNTVYYLAMEGTKLQELYAYNLKTGETEQLTHLNEEVLRDVYVAQPQKIDFENDGVALDGWVLAPKDYEPGTSYPAILDIHGGPCAVYGEIFYHEMQLWANEGYFVFFCNPRGSDGKGEAFADIRGKLGTIDYDDFMKFTDEVLARYPDIDRNRVGVTGGSYGGYMTNWLIGHTDRFACAASQRSISNWVAENAYSDIGFPFGNDTVQGMPWGDVQKIWDQSPLQYADRCVTPTLFIHSTEDFRCPLPEGLAMYTAIANCKVPARMCIFKGESHGLSRGGKPKHRVRRLREITDWMNQYLKK